MSAAKLPRESSPLLPPVKAPIEPRRIPAHVELLAGKDFVARARATAASISPLTPAAAAAFASGPEISGGTDVDPSDA